MIRYYAFFAIIFFLYGLFYWFSVRKLQPYAKILFLLASLVVLSVVIVLLLNTVYLGLAGGAAIIFLALLAGRHEKIEQAVVLQHGMLSGLWLALPLYIYTLANG